MPTLRTDGRTVAYDSAGDGPGAPLLLVHGFTGGRDDFAGVLDRLGAQRRAVAVDLPGHGGSAGPDDPSAYGLSALADWALRVAGALGLEGFHLLGHSLGGLVAQRVAAAASQHLRSLVLMDTGLGAPREEAARRAARVAVAARDEGPEAALDASQAGGVPLDSEQRRAALSRFRALNPVAVVGSARGLVQATPLGAFLRGIDLPVLVVHGVDDDVWTPSQQRLLAATIPGAEHVVVPRAGHSPQRDNPEAWLAAVNGFLGRVDAGERAGP